MEELQKKVNYEFHELVKKLMTLIKEGEKAGGLDLTFFVTELSTTDQKVSELFHQARERIRGKKRGLF